MFDNEVCWLTPREQNQAIANLIKYGLINYDNKRSLPLKKGGTTDIYANLRLMRSRPDAIQFLAKLYENPLRRLGVDRFVEVPEAVSPLAGVVSVLTNLPIVTIREEEKLGRVVKGKFIGELKAGEKVAILDDVITDGRSKLPALTALRQAGVEVAAIVVIVDRQQGWKKVLAEAGFDHISVWPAMTLHTVRRYLVEKGLMQRCDPKVEERNPIIVALDGRSSWDEVLPLIDQLRPSGCILKANDLLWEDNINRLITDLSVYGRVIVDAKLHDIPNTISNYCQRLRATPPWAITVHASGGAEMIHWANVELVGTSTLILAVTLLTSVNDECETIYSRRPLPQVMKLAEIAWEGGAHGFVCSEKEAAKLRKQYPEAVILVPGLRSPGKNVQDQKRVGTFTGAKKAGANFFVGGRQFLHSSDPVAEIFRVAKEELFIDLKS